MDPRGGRKPLVAAVATALTVAACTSSSANPPPDTITVAPTTRPQDDDDKILKIGILLPSNGEGAAIGQSARAAISEAITLANNSPGKVLGQDVISTTVNEGPDTVSALTMLQELIEAHVDVIIGPASSNNELALAPKIVAAGIAACSPSASAMALDDFPDSNFLFRTIPSDSLEAEAMARVVERTGETSVAIAYVDDGYGRPMAAALRTALLSRGVSVDDSVPYSVDDEDFSEEAGQLDAAGNGALALVGDAEAGPRLLGAIFDKLKGKPATDIIVNDALRHPWPIGLVDARAETNVDVMGVSPQVTTQSADLLQLIRQQDSAATGLFATQAYDCANLFMLAAEQAGSTDAAAIAGEVAKVSSGGSQCTTFLSCQELLADGRNIDYDSPGSQLTLGPSGDPSVGIYDQFSFDETTGRDVSRETVTVTKG